MVSVKKMKQGNIQSEDGKGDLIREMRRKHMSWVEKEPALQRFVGRMLQAAEVAMTKVTVMDILYISSPFTYIIWT